MPATLKARRWDAINEVVLFVVVSAIALFLSAFAYGCFAFPTLIAGATVAVVGKGSVRTIGLASCFGAVACLALLLTGLG